MQITPTHKKAIDHYYNELTAYHEKKVTHETAVRSAFQNLLAAFAQSANWVLIPEQTLSNGKRPDGTLRDTFNLPRGYWEAKDTKDDLNTEIRKKINARYPISNTIFEDTRRAVLYQNNKQVLEVDLTQPKELINVLDQLFNYAAPDIASFEKAIQDFKESIPDLAQGLLKRIKEEHARNKSFVASFATFLELCRTSLDPNMSSETVDEMLVQHLLTERLFRTIFNNQDFTNRNVIAAEIEKVIQALTSRAFNRSEFLKSLDRFYIAIENAAKNLDDWAEKQHFLNTVYERFFQGFSTKQADTRGIVYTPQEIVDFMCASVEEVLQREFHTSISTPGVQILDPCTGTGNFIVNLIQRISGGTLATNRNALSDAYVKFFRWAVDRLQGRDGIVCFVSNNGFLEGVAFDGFRKHLAEEFTHIYNIDLGGNARKQGGGNVFGIMVGVSITILVRRSKEASSPFQPGSIFYYRVLDEQRGTEKLKFLAQKNNISAIEWVELQPDERYTWITEGIQPEFAKFLPLGTKEAKLGHSIYETTIFRLSSGGVKTNRDTWAFDFNQGRLIEKMRRFIELYNSDADRWKRRGDGLVNIDDFVTYDDRQIKWSWDLKTKLMQGKYARFSNDCIRPSLYRPFTKQYLYFDALLNNSVHLQPLFFPPIKTQCENIVICVPGLGNRKDFGCLATNMIPSIDLAFEKAQCFPYYTYSEDSSNRNENITDWVLFQFRANYSPDVTKWDIFHYVYAMLHHLEYRECYAENLKRDLPHIPLLKERSAFEACVRIGKRLMDIHLNYEQAAEYALTWIENREVPVNWYVEKMRLTPNKDALVVNEWLTLTGIPQECFTYRLGNRSALEWVIDQYQVSTHVRSGIVSDPNRDDEPEYIVRLVGRVITVSVETVKLVEELEQAVNLEDEIGETVQVL